MNANKFILLSAAFVITTGIKPMNQSQPLATAPEIEAPNLGTLPQPAIEQICKHLPLKDIVHCKRLCRNWQKAWDHERELTLKFDDLIVIGAGVLKIPLQSPLTRWQYPKIEIQGFKSLIALLLSCQNPVNLDLTPHTVKEFPEKMMALKNLKKLIYCEESPSDRDLQIIFNVESLQRLDLNGNEIEKLPKQINLKNIRVLILYNNRLSDVTALSNCQTLQELDLGQNKLTNLPPEICTFRQLQTLNLSCNKRLTQEAITCVCDLPNLQNLDLSCSRLTTLPEQIAKLRKTLKTLNLKKNPLNPEVIAHIKQLLPTTEIKF